jgi:Flp pilus assembly protein TadD
MQRLFPSLSCWCLAGLLMLALPVGADELSDIQRLQSAGQTADALQRVERALAAKPKDVQLRFVRGVLLAESRRSADAIEMFERLTQDFPELPEPYNNLAALHAAAGDYERAKASLEQALRANPGFATAHENLGDVFAALASRSYARALQLDPHSATVPGKLALVRQLVVPKAGAAAALLQVPQ